MVTLCLVLWLSQICNDSPFYFKLHRHLFPEQLSFRCNCMALTFEGKQSSFKIYKYYRDSSAINLIGIKVLAVVWNVLIKERHCLFSVKCSKLGFQSNFAGLSKLLNVLCFRIDKRKFLAIRSTNIICLKTGIPANVGHF